MMSHFTPDVVFNWASQQAVPPDAPIYLKAPYQSLFAKQDGSDACVLECRAGDRKSYLPILTRNIGNGTREAYSAYGYGGLLGDLSVLHSAVNKMQDYLANSGIAAMFLRHSPFLANQRLMPDSLTYLNRYTYAVDLSPQESFSAQISGLHQKLRWSANFAIRSGLRVNFYPLSECSENKVLAFYAHYHALMRAKGTSSYYLFSPDFFLDHARQLAENCELAEVVDNAGHFCGGALFLLDRSGWTHYHLSAATREAMKLQSMELLILSAVHRYGNAGYRALHLGGGHALDERDGLSRFKSKFATRKLEFHCSTLVCDELAYQRERARKPLANPEFFLISDARGTPISNHTNTQVAYE